jgi:arginase family enzyme
MAKPQWLKEAVYDGVNATFADSRLVLFGAPFDATSSYRKGARLGPQALRKETPAGPGKPFRHISISI